MSDRFEGAAREMGGRAQQTIGEAIGDAKTQASGLYNQALAAVLLAIGIGCLFGRFTACPTVV